MASILPEGLVINSSEVGGVVERMNSEALDMTKVIRLWRDYNTVKRKNFHPTAERLDNYWWRVWGSKLGGPAVGRLFLEISDGDSFVSLRYPTNRDGGSESQMLTYDKPEAASAFTVESRLGITSSSNVPIATELRSILKKTGGSSAVGPRPKARFDTPYESESNTSDKSPNFHVVKSRSTGFKTSKKQNAEGERKKSHVAVSTVAKRKNKRISVRRQARQASLTLAAEFSAQDKIQLPRQTVLRIPSEALRNKKEPPPAATQSPRKRSIPNFANTSSAGGESFWKVENSGREAVLLGQPGPEGLGKLGLQQSPFTEADEVAKNRYQLPNYRPIGDILVPQEQSTGQPYLSHSTNVALSHVERIREEDRPKGGDTEGFDQATMFTKLLVPRFLAAGKSQLTLLLEKGRANVEAKL